MGLFILNAHDNDGGGEFEPTHVFTYRDPRNVPPPPVKGVTG